MITTIILYLFVALGFTYPLVIKIGSFLPGSPNDSFVYLWNIWNFWHQILNNANPFNTKVIMYPIGANLFFHTYAPLISILAYPFKNNLSAFMGIAIIISVFLCLLTSYILIYKLTNNKVASFVGGLVYGISPIIYSFIQSQHYYFLFSAVFYPLGLFLLVRFFESRKYKFYN